MNNDQQEENEGNLLKTQKNDDDDHDQDESLKNIQETQNDNDNKPIQETQKNDNDELLKPRRGRPKKEKLPKEKKPFIMTEKRKEALNKGRQALQTQRQKNHVNKITSNAELIISELLKTKEGKKELEKKIKIAKLMNGYDSTDEEEIKKEPKTRRQTKPKNDYSDDYSDEENNVTKNHKEKKQQPKITITTNEKVPKYTF